MRTRRLIALLTTLLGLATTAGAQFCVPGGGSPIPTAGFGGGGTYPGTLPPSEASSTVVVPGEVVSVTSVGIDGFGHTWIGDLQVVLEDPDGVRHNVFVRPGHGNPTPVGNSGSFNGGDYVFVESGGLSLPTTSIGPIDPPAGTYNQSFDTGGAVWPSGTANIFNTPMESITGSVGVWTLRIYDWFTGDVGSFAGWTLCGETDSGECFLAIGRGPGSASFTPNDVPLATQLDAVDRHYAVLQDSMPEFVIPRQGHSVNLQSGLARLIERPDRRFAVQVLMHNPVVFPQQPFHQSHGLLVIIDVTGQVTTVPYGRGSMSVWARIGTNGGGERTLSFPFTMPQ